MRSERVETNLRCNQNCTYCTARRSEDDPSLIAPAAVARRIKDAVARGGSGPGGVELILTGGEPTLRRDLGTLIQLARRSGAAKITVETNATALDAPSAGELRRAGLDHAVVNLSGTSAALDEVTQDPGGFERTLEGIEALLGAGCEVTVRAALVRSTHAMLPALPALLVARFGGRVRALELMVPSHAPDAAELISFSEAGPLIEEIEARARRAPIPLKLAPGSGPPPCVFSQLDRVAHLFALTKGASARQGHEMVASCASCGIRDRCSGFPSESLARFGMPEVNPVTTDRMRRRLAVLTTVEEQMERELVTPSHYRDPVHGQQEEALIRVVFACNQACRFCFVSTHLPGVSDARVEEAIRDAAEKGHKITLSGGEPTLHPRLVSFVRLSKSLTKLPVLLQTNAVRLGERPELAQVLKGAGLDEAFVSLHGATAATSDAVTEAPGTYEKTLLGLDALEAAGVALQINFVICQKNAHELPQWVEQVHRRWPSAFANISFVAPSTDVVPRDAALVPRYAAVLPFVLEAYRLAQARGLALGGFESMCGIPLCLVPGELQRFATLAEVAPDGGAGEFIKPAPCERCSLSFRCWGVRRGYLELHGESELRPVE